MEINIYKYPIHGSLLAGLIFVFQSLPSVSEGSAVGFTALGLCPWFCQCWSGSEDYGHLSFDVENVVRKRTFCANSKGEGFGTEGWNLTWPMANLLNF